MGQQLVLDDAFPLVDRLINFVVVTPVVTAVVQILDGDTSNDGHHLAFDPILLLLALLFLLLGGLQSLREFGQSEIIECLLTSLNGNSGEEAGIGSLERFDLAFDPLGDAVLPMFLFRDGECWHRGILVVESLVG